MTDRTTIRLSSDLARRAKKHAARTRRTFTQLVEHAIVRLLSEEAKPKRRKRIVLPTFGDPSKQLKWEDLQCTIEEQQLEDDLGGLGLKPDAAPRR